MEDSEFRPSIGKAFRDHAASLSFGLFVVRGGLRELEMFNRVYDGTGSRAFGFEDADAGVVESGGRVHYDQRCRGGVFVEGIGEKNCPGEIVGTSKESCIGILAGKRL